MCNLSDLVEERGIEKGDRQGYKRGYEQGLERGVKQGVKQGTDLVNRVNRLILSLSQDRRFDDLARSASDPAYQEKLMKEYGILPTGEN